MLWGTLPFRRGGPRSGRVRSALNQPDFNSTPMPERAQPEALLVEHIGWIERVAASVCRRHALTEDDAADFTSWVKLRLVEDDYAIIRKFRGESAMRTYLTVIVATLFRDYRVSRWGRWRPSAAAVQRGQVAIRLETLVRRDGYRLEHATELLRTTGETTLSDRELTSILRELPVRGPLRPLEVGPAPLDVAFASEGADSRLEASETEARRRSIASVLARGVARLSPEDQVVVRMRFWDGVSVADIARGLGLAQKPLYRRIERALDTLRSDIERAGVSADDMRAMLGESPSTGGES
jgi:RNA polymerase sigma factor (sigma-70 family)